MLYYVTYLTNYNDQKLCLSYLLITIETLQGHSTQRRPISHIIIVNYC